MAILGDSLVYGIGDAQNGNQGGYPLRLSRKLRRVEVAAVGVPGLTARQLVMRLTRAFSRGRYPELRAAVSGADFVVIDIGRNDRWYFGAPQATFRNLKRIRALIANRTKSEDGTAALVINAVLMLPNRGSQAPWIRELNQLILAGNKAAAPADLRFDLVSKTLLTSDAIHPSSAGYDALRNVLFKYLTRHLPRRMRRLRPDLDGDGIYDMFEVSKFGTDPTLYDTDGDGKSDGDEVFVFGTDPLMAD